MVRIKWSLLVAMLFGWSVVAYLQEIHLEVTKTNVEVGEPLELKISYKSNGNLEIKTPDEFQFGGAEQSMMQQALSANGTLEVNMVYIRNGYFTGNGSFTVGPAELTIGRKTVKSNVVQVVVGSKNGNQNNDIPSEKQQLKALLKRKNFAGVLDVSENKIFEGQAVVVNSRVITKMYPDNLSGYQPYSVKGVVESYPLGKGEEIESKQIHLEGRDLLSFGFDKKVMFFNKSGNYRVSPFSIHVEYGGFFSQNVRSNPVQLTVVPLPKNKPSDFNGVVGSLAIEEDIVDFEPLVGKVNKLKITVSGEGNIHEAAIPQIRLSRGWEEVAKPTFSSKYTFGEKGASGTLSYEYFIKCVEQEATSIGPITLSYFDTEKETYVQLATKPIYTSPHQELHSPEDSTRQQDLAQDTSTPKEVAQDPISVNKYPQEDEHEQGPMNNPIFWITLASIVSLGVLVGVLVKPEKIKTKLGVQKPRITKKSIEATLAMAQTAFIDGNTGLGLQKMEESIFMQLCLKYKKEYASSHHAQILKEYQEQEGAKAQKEITNYVASVQLFRFGSVQDPKEAERLKADAEKILEQISS